MKQILIPLVGTILFIFLVGYFTKNQDKIVKNENNVIAQDSARINNIDINLEVSDSEEERAKGLSSRKELGEKEGMLFVFDKENTTPTFWMKDMLIGIDIIWINDNKIIQIDKNVQTPKEGTPDNKLIRYAPKSSVDYVLEVNSGFSDKYDLKVDDTVVLNLSK
jgi:uncharacterized membrane protein (UPF0127 family)